MTKNQVRMYMKKSIAYHHAKNLQDRKTVLKYDLILDSYEHILYAENDTIPHRKHLDNIFDIADDIADILVKENIMHIIDTEFDDIFSRLCYEVYAMELDNNYKYNSCDLRNALIYDRLSRRKDEV